MSATVGTQGRVVFSPGVRVLLWHSAREAGKPDGRAEVAHPVGRRIQTGRAAGVPRLSGKRRGWWVGLTRGPRLPAWGRDGPQISGVAECVRLCAREPAWDWGSRGKREKSSKQAEVFPPFKVMLSVSEDRPLPPSPGVYWGSECSLNINSPFAKGVDPQVGGQRGLEGNSPGPRGGGILKWARCCYRAS